MFALVRFHLGKMSLKVIDTDGILSKVLLFLDCNLDGFIIFLNSSIVFGLANPEYCFIAKPIAWLKLDHLAVVVAKSVRFVEANTPNLPSLDIVNLLASCGL